MGFTRAESVAPPPLTPARLEWLKYALTQYGVSAAGADQFTQSQPVTGMADRQALLGLLNRVVVEESRRPPGFQGKGH